MGYGGDDFEHLLAPADLRRAEREIGAFVEGDVELDAAIGAADVEHMQLGNCTLAKGELYLPNRAFILHDRPAQLAACGHHDALGRGQGPRGGDSVDHATTSSFVARSEEQTSALQSLMHIQPAAFYLHNT